MSMASVTAHLRNYRQSPRKVRSVANLIRGKSVVFAQNQLTFLTKRAGDPLKRLIESGVANAKQANLNIEDLRIKEIRVDGGTIMYRRLPASRGRATPLRKRTSHVRLVLTDEAKQSRKK